MLVVTDIRKSWGGRPVLRGVSFEVGPGEILGLLGSNGAGKTTVLRIVLGVIRADGGRVELFGAERTRKAIDRVSYLPEESGLYRRRSVRDALTYFARLKGVSKREARSRAESWLERLGLSGVAGSSVDRLSKGTAQRVQIAVALISEPDLCILDEPFTGLDPINAEWLTRLLDERRREGRSTILALHEMHRVERLCDRIALIDRGESVLTGRVDEVRRAFTRAAIFLRATGDVPIVEGIEYAESVGPREWRLVLRSEEPPNDVLRRLLDAGLEVHSFEPVVASLEEVFLRVVGRRTS